MPILPDNSVEYTEEAEAITSENMTDGSSVTENNATYNDPFDYNGPADIGVPDPLPVVPVVPEEEDEYYYVTYYNRGDLTEYEPAYLQELAEAGCKFYAIYDDDTEVEIQWTEIEDLDPLETEIDISTSIAAASNQHFWDDTNGVHVAEVAKEDWQTALEAEFSDLSSSKNYYNILMNSLGLLLRRANFILTSINRASISFYDGLGNETTNIMASFGRNSAQIGRSNDKHVVINSSGLTAYNSDGTLAPLTGTFDGANINNSSITNAKIVDGTIEGTKIASATIDNSNIKNGTIEGTKIASATIDNSNIKNGTIEGTKIASATIDNSNIKNGTITGTKIASATIDNSNIKNGTITGAKIADGTIENTDIKNGTITGAKIASATIENSNIKDGTIQGSKIIGSTLTDIPYAGISDADVEVARVANAEIAKAEVNYAHITNGVIDNAKINHADVNGLSANYATVANLNAATARIGVLEAADVTIDGRLDAAEADIDDLKAEDARIGNLVAQKASITDLNAATARIGSLEAADVTIDGRLDAAEADIDDLEADHVSVEDFEAEQANIDTLQANTADIATIRANSAKVQNLTAAQLEADHATVGSLSTTYATITNLNAATGRISDLESTRVRTTDLEANYITADTIEANYTKTDLSNTDVAWIQNGTIKDGAISNAMIGSLSASKLTAGTINGNTITVTNLNADNITAGTLNGQRIGEGSLSLSKLEEDVYTESEVDSIVSNLQTQIDGAIETWTGTAVPTLNNSPASGWTTNAIKDTHVGDVYFVVNSNSQQNGYNYRFTKSGSTYSWQLIKDSDVTNALQRLTTAEGKIGTIEQFDSDISSWKTDTDEELASIKSAATTLAGRVTTAEGQIATKVETSTFNTLSQTVNENVSSIQSLTNETTTITQKITSEVPYSRVEWVESIGKQLLTIDWKPGVNGAFGFDADFIIYNGINNSSWATISDSRSVAETKASCLFGIRQTGDIIYWQPQYAQYMLATSAKYGAGGSLMTGGDKCNAKLYTDKRRQQCSLRNGVYTAPDGSQTTLSQTEYGIGNSTMQLFGLFTNSGTASYTTTTCAIARVYSLKFYDDSDLAVDLVPVVRNRDNMPGLYDNVKQKFYALSTGVSGPYVGPFGESEDIKTIVSKDNPVLMDMRTTATRLAIVKSNSIDKLEDGQRITVQFKYGTATETFEAAGITNPYYSPASSNSQYLRLIFSDGTYCDHIIWYSPTTSLTTQYGAGSQVTLVYHNNVFYGSGISLGGWYCDANYDTNSNTVTDKIAVSVVAGLSGIFPYSLVMRDQNDNWTSLTTTGGTSTSKARYTGGLKWDNIAYSSPNATYAAGSNTGDGLFNSYNIDIRYSTNVANNANSGLIARQPLYLVGEVHSDGLFYLDNPWWTQTEPTTEDGKTYIFVGMPSSYYMTWLVGDNVAYRYIDGEFAPFYTTTITKSVNRINEVTDTVSEHTRKIGLLETSVESKADGSTVETMSTKLNTVSDTVDGHTQSISSITSTQTTMQGKLDKTLVETTQLWFSKANTTAPNKPTVQVTSTSTEGNAWRVVVPAYNASYPNYYYCYQWKYSDGTYGWSSVTRDIAMGESQERARTAITNAAAADTKAGNAASAAATAQSTADTANTNASAAVSTANTASDNASTALSTANTAASDASDAKADAATAVSTANTASSNASTALSTANTASSNASTAVSTANTAKSTADTAKATADKNVKSTTQLWYTKANETAPAKPTTKITSTAVSGNGWRIVVPTYASDYPYYFYCYQYELADGTFTWSDVVYDRATTENQANSRSAVTGVSTLTTKTNNIQDTVDGHTQSLQSITQTQTTIQQNAVKSTVQLWFTKANTTAPSKPTAHVTTNNAATGNAWNLAVPTYNASYPNYYYCYEYEFINGGYGWSAVTRDIATGEMQATARKAQSDIDNLEIGGRNLLPSSIFTNKGIAGSTKELGPVTPATMHNCFGRNDGYIFGTFEENTQYTFRVGAIQSAADETWVGHNGPDFVFRYTDGTYDDSATQIRFFYKNEAILMYKTLVSNPTKSVLNIYSTYGYSHCNWLFYDMKLEKGNRATDWTPAPEDIDAGISTAQTSANNAQTTANKNVKESVQLWFTKANGSAPSKPTSAVTSTSTSGNAWTTKVPTYSASYPHYFYCMQYKLADGTYTWSDVVYDQATTEAQSVARTTSTNLSTLQQDYATFKQTTQNFESTIGTTYATKTEVSAVDDKIDNLEIGGRNLLANTRNEAITYAGSGGYFDLSLTDWAKSNIKANDILTLSFDAYSSNSHWIDFYWRSASTSYNSDAYFFPAFQIDSSTLHYTVSSDSGVDINNSEILYLRLRNNSSSHGGAIPNLDITISNLKLEKGNKATDWSPAPEDVDAAINKVNSKTSVRLYLRRDNWSDTNWGANASVGHMDNFSNVHQVSGGATSATGFDATTLNVGDLIVLEGISTGTNIPYSATAKVTSVPTSATGTIPATVISANNAKAIESRVSTAETSIQQTNSQIALKANASDVYTKTQTDGLISTEVDNRNSAIEQSADAISLSVSQNYTTKTEFNALEIGGRNLLRGTGNQTASNYAMGRASVNDGILLIASTTSNAFAKWIVDYLDYDEYGEGKYTASCDIRLANTTSEYTNKSFKIYFGFSIPTRIPNGFSGSYDRFGTATIDSNLITSEWTRVSTTFDVSNMTVGQAAALASGSMLSIEPCTDSSSVPIEVKNLKLEKGTKATDWTPAPEDIDSAISAIPRMMKVNTPAKNFTASQWKLYGARGRNESWSTGSSYDNSKLRVGDRAYVIGTVSDQNGGTATVIGEVTAINPVGSGTTNVYLKAEQLIFGGDIISAIESRVSTAETSITQNNEQIALKANASDVYTKTQTDGLISTEVSNRNSAIEQSAAAINLSVSETYSTKTEVAGLLDNRVQDSDEFLYRISGGATDIPSGRAKIDAIKGNTLRWNQLVNNATSERNGYGIHMVPNSGPSWTVSGTVSESPAQPYMDVSTWSEAKRTQVFIPNHKVLVKVYDTVRTTADRFAYGVFTGGGFGYQEIATTNPKIVTITGVPSGVYLRVATTAFAGQTISGTVAYQLFDLTAMFGSGNEPATVAEFEAMYPLPCYPYDTGSLLPVNMTGIDTNGFNQWDEKWDIGGISNQTGAFHTGERFRSKNMFPVFPNTEYNAKFNRTADDMRMFFYDADKNFISETGWKYKGVFTTPANAYYMAFLMAIGYGTAYKNDICINLSDPTRNGEYEPYWKAKRAIDVSTYFPTGLKKAGAVYDEMTGPEAITRVGSVDLGTVDWTYAVDGDNRYFSSGNNIPDAMFVQNSVTYICSKYESVSPIVTASLGDKQLCHTVNNTSRFFIKDSAYTDAAAFKTAMSGVILYYALATSTTTPIDPPLNLTYKVDKFGTERIIVPDGNQSAPVPIDVTYGVDLYSFAGDTAATFAGLESNLAAAKAEIKVTTDGITSTVEKINSAKYLVSGYAAGTSLANIRSYASNQTLNFMVESTEDARVGDTVYLRYKDTTRNCYVYIKGTVSSINSATSITLNTHGYEDIIPVDTIKSTINQSSDSVKIQARHVEIDGAAIFSNSAFKAAADAAYDAKGSASAVQNNLDNLEIGGRNLLPMSQFRVVEQGPDTLEDSGWISDSSSSGDGRLWSYANSNWQVYLAAGTYILSWETSVVTTSSTSDMQLLKEDSTLIKSFGKNVFANIGKETYSFTINSDRYIGLMFKLYAGKARFKLEKGNRATDWTPAPEDVDAAINAAVDEEQYIYRSAASGTTSMAQYTTWVTANGDTQNAWTTKRPTYSSSYPVLFVAKQRKTVGGTVTCTTPVKDDTTTVIDGGHITTGTIDTNRLNADTIKSNIVQTTELNADKITSGTIAADRIKANVISAVNNGTGTINADKINASNLTIGYSQLTNPPTIPSKVSDLTNDSGFQTSSQVDTAITSKGYATTTQAQGYANTAKSEAISAAATDATNKANAVQTNLDNLEIGGRNLLINTNWNSETIKSFVTSTYTLTQLGNAIGVWAKESQVTLGFDSSGLMTITVPNNSTRYGIYQDVYLNPGHYILSVNTGSFFIAFIQNVQWPSKNGIDANNGRNSVEFDVAESATYRVYIAYNNAAVMYGNWMKLEKSSKATDWTPAPEDVDGAITSVNDAVNSGRNWYAESSTAAGTVAKVATISPATTEFTTDILKPGTTVYVKFSATNSGAVASLTLNVNNTGAKNIKYRVNNGTQANLPAANYIVANQLHKFTYDGTYWVMDINYYTDSTAMYTKYYNAIVAGNTITAASIIGGRTDGKFYQIKENSSFDLAHPLLWTTVAISSGGTNYNDIYTQYNNATLATYYTSFSNTTANRLVYLVGTISGNTFTTYGANSNSYLTVTPPTTADGRFYIPLGRLGNPSNGKNYFNFQVSVPVTLYAYLDGKFRQVTPTEVVGEQYIYCSAVSGTNSMSKYETWVEPPTSVTASTQNSWTTKRPEYSSSYPVLFVAKQTKRLDGTVTCTTPVKDDTTTVIDGGHITTGTIDADRISTTVINAINANVTDTINANKINASELRIGYSQVNDTPTIPTKVSDLTNDSGFQNSTQVNTAITSKGYQTSSQVETAITSKGYQTSTQVETAITSKGYATTTQAQGYADAKDDAIAAAAKRTNVSIAVTAINYDLGTATLQATLYVDGTATTSNVTYKWLKDGSVISGQTARTLSVTAAMGLSHVYSCTVTYS